MQKVKVYKCPQCNKPFHSLGGWSSHVDTIHPDIIPPDYTLARYFYFILTGKTHGNCIQCKCPTKWNEVTMKYERFCGRIQCKDDYVKLCSTRIIGKYGKTTKITINANGKAHLLNNPDQQRLMASSRSISGTYKFQDDGEIGYVGSYEKNFLIMLDTFLNFNSSDIISPSPHHYYYDYKNPVDIEHEGIKFYIPDIYIPSLNLEIEIKENTNNHPKILAIDKVKEKLKDDVMKTNREVNYIKVVENDYSIFFEYFLKLKEEIPNDDKIVSKPSLTTANESAIVSSEIGELIEIEGFYNYAKAIVLESIEPDTIIAKDVVYGQIDGDLGKMRFTNIANAVLSNPVSNGKGSVKFVKYIDGQREKYNLVSTKKLCKGQMLAFDAHNDIPDFFARIS